MDAVGENQDFFALKTLLTSWHVGILYEHFKDEDITIRELKMMDYSHIHCLLNNYKMGVKIRFEYNLKSWRHKLGIPLNQIETNHHKCCYCSRSRENNILNQHRNNTTKTSNILVNDLKRKRLDTDIEEKNYEEQELNQASSSPQSVNSNVSFINTLNSDEVSNMGNTTALTNEKTCNMDNENDVPHMTLQPLGDFLTDFEKDVPPKFPSKFIYEKYSIGLMQILKLSAARGMAIVKFFKTKGRLTNIHRTQLIQIIVDYFIDNDCHLPLNLSHHLEWEILKMFPTEKLEYYRTEKRGKIYSKFSNMKRYKRDRDLKANTEVEMMATNSYRLRRRTEEYERTNYTEENDDSCHLPIAQEIVVKHENQDEKVFA